MLQALHVHNFALIEDARVEFTEGFNILTGETGAGKSILIDAFGIVLGARASSSFIRTGEDSLWVQAVFSPDADGSVKEKLTEILKEQGIEEDEALFLRRSVNKNGRSQSSINGVQVPLAVLRRVSACLVDVHGQHENQELLRSRTPMKLTDNYGGQSLRGKKAAYMEIYRRYRQAEKELLDLETKGSDRERLMDRLDWEINEIKAANIVVGEEERLKEEAGVLRNGHKISAAINKAYNFLDKDGGALEMLAEAREEAATALRYDDAVQPLYDLLDSTWISGEEARSQLRDYVDNKDFDEERMQEVQERMDLLYRLSKKYGGDEEHILEYLEKAEKQYALLEDVDLAIEEAKKKLRKLKAEIETAAAELTEERKKSAALLSEKITGHVQDLAMPHAAFSIEVEEEADYTPSGRDRLEFCFAGNKGEGMHPLGQVASGGELSRIALALKTVLADSSHVPSMVFDEIDTGVGGVTAQKMAEKMALIAVNAQVLCITHLPQIAAFAERHIYIAKGTEEGRTFTKLSVLDRQGRIEEIVRMTAGDRATLAARENAEELLKAAAAYKMSLR